VKGWDVLAVGDVDVTYKWTSWEIVATWPQRTRRSDISTVIKVTNNLTDPARLVLSSTRINLMSASAKNSIAVAMRKIDPDRVDELVHDVCENLLDYFKQSGHTTQPTPKQREGERWLIYPMWPITQGTLVAAATNSFKSIVAVAAAVQATRGVEVLRGNTRATNRSPILYVDWEADEHDFGERLYAVLQGAGLPIEPCVAYRHLYVPLADAAETLAEEIARNQYGGVVIDSLSAAAGGSLVDDELANQFWNAVSLLGVPALVTAHKSEEAIRRGTKRAFGSVMHQNRPRMIWDVRRDPNSTNVVWEVVNDNNTGRKGHKLAWRIDVNTEGADDTERLDSITFEAINPRDVRLAAKEGDTLQDRMVYAIVESGPMLTKELATNLGTSVGAVRTQLNRHLTVFAKHADGLRWDLR